MAKTPKDSRRATLETEVAKRDRLDLHPLEKGDDAGLDVQLKGQHQTVLPRYTDPLEAHVCTGNDGYYDQNAGEPVIDYDVLRKIPHVPAYNYGDGGAAPMARRERRTRSNYGDIEVPPVAGTEDGHS